MTAVPVRPGSTVAWEAGPRCAPMPLCLALADGSRESPWEAQEQAAPKRGVGTAVREAQQRCSIQGQVRLQEAL